MTTSDATPWASRTALGAPRVGMLPSGPRDAITDVPGVRVGHCTLDDGAVQTGATVVVPAEGDLFMHKLPAGVAVINGFGKSAGLMQVQELGSLESPIALVNTFSVGMAYTALVREAFARNPAIGRDLPTVNPVVMECNDGWLNDAQAMALGPAHVRAAMQAAALDFAQGSVGAGRGMSCHGVKGGVGSASRRVQWPGRAAHFTVGVLVLANQGRPDALTVAGQRIGPAVQACLKSTGDALPGTPPEPVSPERGSIIMLVATDAPLDARQLTRVARRTGAGLARTGSDYGHGSGDIALAFSTAQRVAQTWEPAGAESVAADAPGGLSEPVAALCHETQLDLLFQATAEATEQAILHALFAAEGVRGRDGRQRHALRELLPNGLMEP